MQCTCSEWYILYVPNVQTDTYVHISVYRDLTAANVLLSASKVAKVSNFSKTCSSSYITKGVKVPGKWTAPEAIEFQVTMYIYCVCVCVRVRVRVCVCVCTCMHAWCVYCMCT